MGGGLVVLYLVDSRGVLPTANGGGSGVFCASTNYSPGAQHTERQPQDARQPLLSLPKQKLVVEQT